MPVPRSTFFIVAAPFIQSTCVPAFDHSMPHIAVDLTRRLWSTRNAVEQEQEQEYVLGAARKSLTTAQYTVGQATAVVYFGKAVLYGIYVRAGPSGYTNASVSKVTSPGYGKLLRTAIRSSLHQTSATINERSRGRLLLQN